MRKSMCLQATDNVYPLIVLPHAGTDSNSYTGGCYIGEETVNRRIRSHMDDQFVLPKQGDRNQKGCEYS